MHLRVKCVMYLFAVGLSLGWRSDVRIKHANTSLLFVGNFLVHVDIGISLNIFQRRKVEVAFGVVTPVVSHPVVIWDWLADQWVLVEGREVSWVNGMWIWILLGLAWNPRSWGSPASDVSSLS